MFIIKKDWCISDNGKEDMGGVIQSLILISCKIRGALVVYFRVLVVHFRSTHIRLHALMFISHLSSDLIFIIKKHFCCFERGDNFIE